MIISYSFLWDWLYPLVCHLLVKHFLRIIIIIIIPIIIIWNHSAVCKLFILDRDTSQIELVMLNSNTWNHLTVGKEMINIK